MDPKKVEMKDVGNKLVEETEFIQKYLLFYF